MRVRREYITLRTRQRVAERARHTCEYCRHRDDYIYDSFEIEHIIPLAHPLSSNALRNLAYACGGCNGFKGVKTHATDPDTGEEVPLYNPRQQRWSDHFAWTPDYTQMIGLTPTGRATVDALRLNRVGLQNLRRSLHRDGQHPPEDPES